MARVRALIVSLAGSLLLTAVAGAAPAGAAVRDCDVFKSVDTPKLANAGVTSVRNMTCGAARRAIRRHGQRQSNAAYGEAGRRFGLGPWSCTVYLHNYELWQARCVKGKRAFRVDYGF
jgi:hypothetical protein